MTESKGGVQIHTLYNLQCGMCPAVLRDGKYTDAGGWTVIESKGAVSPGLRPEAAIYLVTACPVCAAKAAAFLGVK